jgi:tRNA pseudouridine65 synthase
LQVEKKENMLEILFEDSHYVAVNKPNGLLVHRTRLSEEKKEFALQLLRDQLGYRLYPVHRLDRPTSGLLLFAKSPESAAAMSKSFAERLPRKTYFAVVRGYAPEEGSIDKPLQPDNEKQQKEAREAITHFNRLATVELPIAVGRYQTARYSLVKVQPETGRMHQIRRHFAHLRHYIIGDTKHGDWRHNRMFLEKLGSPELLLHAAAIHLKHPFSKELLAIRAQMPNNMLHICKQFAWLPVLESQPEFGQQAS